MQLQIVFIAENLVLPIAYNHILQGFVYSHLQNRAYSSDLHEMGFLSDDNRSYKLFTFSSLKGKYRIDGKRIFFAGPVSWEIRSCDVRMIQLLLQNIRVGENMNLGGNSVTVQVCNLMDTKVYSSDIIVRMDTPVVVYQTHADKSTVYLSPEEPSFYRSLSMNTSRKVSSSPVLQQKGLNGISVLFEPSSSKRYYRRIVTTFKGTYITGYLGDFRIIGNPEILDLLYNTGLGAKNSQGFGIFSILAAEHAKNL